MIKTETTMWTGVSCNVAESDEILTNMDSVDVAPSKLLPSGVTKLHSLGR